MLWPLLRLKSWRLAWIGLMLLMLNGCPGSQTKKDQVEAFFCDPEPAYTETGAPDTDSYRVNKACLRGLSMRVKACYKPQ